MSPKAYLAVISTTLELLQLQPMMNDIKRILGHQSGVLTAWDKGAVIGFYTVEETAESMREKLINVVDKGVVILIVKLGPDYSLIGWKHNFDWFSRWGSFWEKRDNAP